ncbi:hypothetical protein E2C01_057601 [Portunus trituberculatus]|uniref:Uncharacterized protein n=1 Tax=Portunus trituberculatus TaxID=210409 RepID=A0A5B7H0G4_PORTR|nr:hypothetical protein [Portunus trituberculatus]
MPFSTVMDRLKIDRGERGLLSGYHSSHTGQKRSIVAYDSFRTPHTPEVDLVTWLALRPELVTRTRPSRLWRVPALRGLTACRLIGFFFPVIYWTSGKCNLSPVAPWHSTCECLLLGVLDLLDHQLYLWCCMWLG